MHTRVLVVDDEPLVRRSMERALTDQGFEVRTAASIAEGFTAFEALRPQVVVLDVRLPDGSGLDMLPRLRRADPALKVLMVTAFGETSDVVRAMKAGAADFLKKPYDLEELLHAVKSAAKSMQRDRRLKIYRRQDQARNARSQMIGGSPAMQAIKELLRKVAISESTTVLVTGESGTGKELVARALHFQSARRDGPLMEVNCSTFQENLLENELFGHEKGAYTGASFLKRGLVELCDGGTLFLDEVSEMSPRVQAKLLRFLDNQTFKRVGGNVDLSVDVRLIAATNADLERRIASGSLRPDLLFRLKVVSIHLPPLRERGDDILLLARSFLERFSREFRKDFHEVAPDAAERLLRYPWPGNVRELENLMERIVLLEDGPELRAVHLPPEMRAGPGRARPPAEDAVVGGEDLLRSFCARLGAGGEPIPPLREVTDAYIDLVLSECEGNRSRAARTLGLSRQGLLDRIRRREGDRPHDPTESLAPNPTTESL
jgi:two-component system, NtrC family, response regulator AtoC